MRISIHALREEGDSEARGVLLVAHQFLSTPSARRATWNSRSACTGYLDISIHALREEGDLIGVLHAPEPQISIHALREEGDSFLLFFGATILHFYPRPPRGGRLLSRGWVVSKDVFLSTPSARRATRSVLRWEIRAKNFYPRPPRGGRLTGHNVLGADSLFLSTPSARRATTFFRVSPMPTRFLSTPSARRATLNGGYWDNEEVFLSTPSARRATPCSVHTTPSSRYFYPRPPRGGRPRRPNRLHSLRAISIHALREEGDSKNRDKISIFKQIIQHSARI